MFKQSLCSLGLCCLLGAASLLLLTTPASAASYKDVSGHWAADVIEKWSDTGILSGYADGTFRPGSPVTRAQLATVLYRIWGCEPVKDGFSYPDLPRDLWCYDALNTMNMYGVALNRELNILPDQPLTREEAFYMIGQTFFLGITPLSRKDTFDRISDAADISPQYEQTIQWLVIDGYVNGSADGKLNPKRGITRAEVMKIIDNIVHVYITKPGTYQVHAKQNVLVTCGGVTLQRTDVPAGYVNPRRTSFVRNYLFGSAAAEGGVAFENHMAGDLPSTFYLYMVSEQEPSYRLGERCQVQWPKSYAAATYAFPDTRFTSGFGKKGFPYLITSADQFRLLAECLDDTPLGRKYFKLLRDVDLGTLSAPLGAANGDGRIHAYLDGGGHTVTYQMPSATLHRNSGGLFSYWGGDCSNLTVAGRADVTFAKDAPGQPKDYFLGGDGLTFGGFAGYFEGWLKNCATTMDLTVRYGDDSGKTYVMVGGWAGSSLGKDFQDCQARGSVKLLLSDQSTSSRVGGFLGLGSTQSRSYIEMARCGASGAVYTQGGDYTLSGGLVGQFSSPYPYLDKGRDRKNWALVNCWSTADVSAAGAQFQCEVGGLIGQLYSGSIRECWAKPTLSVRSGSYQNLGGLAGSCRAMGAISDSWANTVNCQGAGGDVHVGGITGRLDQGSVSNCYTLGAAALGSGNAIAYQSWNDGSVSASTDMTGIAKSVRELFYQSCGWDFTAVWDKAGTYPILKRCDPAAQRAAQ